MCGFVGCVVNKLKSDSVMLESLQMLSHRGPDQSKFDSFTSPNSFVYLGHTRLSIIDLTEDGSQPFHSKCGRFSLIFNGEIYNYRELRLELESLNFVFETETDTEVLLNALIKWGTKCLDRLIGMFSFVFYDKKNQKLTLARDAFGIKPFYYAIENNEVYFSSELPSLLKIKEGDVKPNLQVAYDYLVHGDYDSSEESFIEGIKHIQPAHYIVFDIETGVASKPQKWWEPNVEKESQLDFKEASNKLKQLFLESVKLHLRSDVPLGVALSGGIDSSAVVSSIRHLEPDMQLNTFSYVADDKRISEEVWVDSLNDRVGAIPHKVLANQEEMKIDLDSMILRQGEPFGGTSIYAQYRVFKLAKENGVKVTLDGQGADELLAGYSGYPGHRLLSLVESEGWTSAIKYAWRWGKQPGRSFKLAWQYYFRLTLPDRLYGVIRKRMGRDFSPRWLELDYLSNAKVRFNENRPKLSSVNKGRRVKEVLAKSLMTRGLPSLLRHGDRNSMAFSVESRVPFLTLPLANFLLSLPEDFLISKDGTTKHIFREAMRGIMPDSHIDRKDKIGFATPESTWLLSMMDVIQQWLEESADIPFINKDELLVEFSKVRQGKRKFDGKVWRWVNYIRWYNLVVTPNQAKK